MKKSYLDLSTAHLSRDTRNLLDRYDGVNNWQALGWPAITLASYEYGWFVTVPPVELPDVAYQMESMPADLRCCLLEASVQGCDLVRFDADGHIDGDLPYYQEI